MGKMKFCNRKLMTISMLIALSVFAIACNNKPTSNLLINGDAELPPYDSVPKGWQEIKSNWVSLQGDSDNHNFGFAQHGHRFFFSGFNPPYILQQDVDVSEYAKTIDNNKQKFVLTGYERSLDQAPLSDQAILKIFCFDKSKKDTLYRYASDSLMSKEKWIAVGDTFTAPAHTRYVRVQLVDILNFGMGSDGYFDNLSLTTNSTGFLSSTYWLWIAIALLLVVLLLFVFKSRRARLNKPKPPKIPIP